MVSENVNLGEKIRNATKKLCNGGKNCFSLIYSEDVAEKSIGKNIQQLPYSIETPLIIAEKVKGGHIIKLHCNGKSRIWALTNKSSNNIFGQN